jgi:hypothetical protein
LDEWVFVLFPEAETFLGLEVWPGTFPEALIALAGSEET